jgi:hypothetical protein
MAGCGEISFRTRDPAWRSCGSGGGVADDAAGDLGGDGRPRPVWCCPAHPGCRAWPPVPGYCCRWRLVARDGKDLRRWLSRPGSLTRAWRNAGHTARRLATGRQCPATPDGQRPKTARIRSPCSRSRTAPVSPTWSRSATGGCWSRRSPSTAAAPRSWRPTSPAPPWPACGCSCVGMRICRTSACSPHPSGGCCSTSTTSTRRSRGRLSGM